MRNAGQAALNKKDSGNRKTPEQIDAAVSGTWPAELEQFVAGVRTDDFLVTDTDIDTCLDLVVVAS